MSARSVDGRDAEYLEWHGLDHLPEQYRITGMRSGTRWVSTAACRAVRAASTPPSGDVDHVVAYLFADPVDPGLDTFFALGKDLREAGRMPALLPPVELGGYRVADMAAAPRVLVGADVLPWRPHRGVYLLMEDGAPSSVAGLLEVEGVAGAWTFAGSASLHDRLAVTEARSLTVLYLDDNPALVGQRLEAPLRERWTAPGAAPLLAAPFVTVTPWAWDAALPT
ncbi:MAG: hypothetical protein ACT452_03950 [Microthrixaceae bacterium]